jgi:two-component system sensor histidine kinase/response regulator
MLATAITHEAMFSGFMSETPDHFYFKDLDLRFVSLSQSLARSFGLTVDEIIGRTDQDLFGAERAREFCEVELELIRTGVPVIDHVVKHVWPDGHTTYSLNVAKLLRDKAGQPVGLWGTNKDVTQLKATEAQLARATEAALAASQTKSAFLANMSHEIRTPMNGVLGMTELLLDTPLGALQRDYALTIRNSAKALLSVINDILDFSKVEAGKLELEQVEFAPRQVVEEVARVIAFQADLKKIEIVTSIDPELPDHVRGDDSRLRQILINLCGNAVKFTQQGEIVIEAKLLASTPEGPMVRFEVRDTGIGIAADLHTSLFEPFTQADVSTTRRYGGSGLGLSIVRRLVALMGGRVGLISDVEKGSTFWFTAAFRYSDGKQSPLRTLNVLQGQRALVVDDNATNRKILEAQLRGWKIECVCASSAQEALQALRQSPKRFDVALLDHHMPDCDGAQLGQIINADPELKSTRLVLLTAGGDHSEWEKFAALGFAGYLLKPVLHGDLIEALSLVLASDAEAWQTGTHPIITGRYLREHRGPTRARILVVEDDHISRRIAVSFVEGIGYSVHAVENGREAVAAWRNGGYDLVLMDCQMPEFDGYAATREIRSLEPEGTHIPIIAVTANAMVGAEAKALASGMDAQISKPVDRGQLEACVHSFLVANARKRLSVADELPPASAAVDQPSAAVVAPQWRPVDLDALLAMVGGDGKFMEELLQMFINGGEELLAIIEKSLAGADIELVEKTAHRLKGNSGYIQAAAVRLGAERLESAARAKKLDELVVLAGQLRSEYAAAVEFIRKPRCDA